VYTKCTIHKIRHGTTHPQLTRIETGNHHNPLESHLQFRFFVLCLLGIPGPRSVWPAAPGIPSLLEHRPLRCKPLVPPSQFDPAEYDVIPHGAKSLGHGTEGLLPPSLENPSSFKTRGPIHTMQCLPVGYKFYSKTIYKYILQYTV